MVKDDKNQRLTVRAASTQLSRKVTQMNYEHRQASQASRSSSRRRIARDEHSGFRYRRSAQSSVSRRCIEQ